ncbi:MAG TPA: 4Fe-4S dicluster domain-containing protein [Bacillota bacterium]|nr:4Fe-4S dicluster domain-containing protein [Bacillota bacterium]
MPALGVNEPACTLCGRCLVACAAGRAVLTGALDPAWLEQSLLRVDGPAPPAHIRLCRHCLTAPCVDACVARALRRDAAGDAVSLDSSRCVGCYSCVMECPFSAPLARAVSGNAGRGTVIAKCDGCAQLPEPLCAAVCPTGAIRAAGDARSASSRARRRRAVGLGLAGHR